MKSNHFQHLLSSYFLKYIPERTTYSENTIKAYRDTFILFFQYNEQYLKKSVSKFRFEMISKDYLINFLVWLEKEKKYSVSSINLRLSALHAFFKYVQMEKPEYIEICTLVFEIKNKKIPISPMNYISLEAVKFLFNLLNNSTKECRREMALLVLLYDSGARVQEIADLKFGDVRNIRPATLKLHGKGNKTRVIPLMPQTLDILNLYMNDCKRLKNIDYTHPLFFNKKSEKLTRAGISYILDKYVRKAKKLSPELFSGKISPHTLRHSKAMHLLEGGVNLIYIRDFLGHSTVITTEIYAKANPEIKRKALETASPNLLPEEKYTKNEKEDMLEWLKTII